MPSKSVSTFQSVKEKEIREFLEREWNIPLMSGGKVLSGVRFQFDVMNEQQGWYGEIYVCQFPLKSGQIRKIKSDILKLITLEKILGIAKINKRIILTISENHRAMMKQGLNKILIEHDVSNNLIGLNSWLNKAINIFDIKLFYYVMNDQQYSELSMVRAIQKEGISELSK